MKIGILVNRITWEVKELKAILEKQGINYKILNNQKIYFKLSRNKDIEQDFDLFLERSLSYLRGLYTSVILETKGYKLINNFNCLNLTGNKLLTTLKLLENDIPTPDVCIAFKDTTAIKAIEQEIEYPAIIKPVIGSWGRLIAKIDDYNSAVSNLECREIMGNFLQKIYYIQKYIPKVNENKPTDIRVFVIGDQCIAAMGRYNPEKDFRSNIAIGGSAKKIDVYSELEHISIAASKAVEGEIVGVDLMEENGDLKVIEVNGTPQFQGISTRTKINIAENIVNYIKENYA